MAPPAPQGAPLQEHGRADARSILEAVFLNVEHNAVLHGGQDSVMRWEPAMVIDADLTGNRAVETR
jgi:hypothetical protein